MKRVKIVYNPRPLDKILLIRLIELKKSLKIREGFIPVSNVREKLCRNFSINKLELKEVLDFLANSGFIEISQIGIKLNFVLENDK